MGKILNEKNRRIEIDQLFDDGLWDRRNDTIPTLQELLRLSGSSLIIPDNPSFEELFHLSVEWLSSLEEIDSDELEERTLYMMKKISERMNF